MREWVRKDIHLCRCLLDRNPGLQMAHQRNVLRLVRGFAPGKGFGKPHIRTPQAEARRHHADHYRRPAIQKQGSPDDLRVSAELALPGLVPQDDHARRFGLSVGGRERRPSRATGRALGTCCRSPSPRRKPPAHPGRSAQPRRAYNRSLCQIRGSVCGSREIPEPGPIPSSNPGHKPDLWRPHRQAMAVRVRERVEHRAFDHAEHRRGGADAERERDRGQNGEAGVLPQHPQAVA